jgi:hypothetical protein
MGGRGSRGSCGKLQEDGSVQESACDRRNGHRFLFLEIFRAKVSLTRSDMALRGLLSHYLFALKRQ